MNVASCQRYSFITAWDAYRDKPNQVPQAHILFRQVH